MDQVEPLGLELDRSRVEDGLSPVYTIPSDNHPRGIFMLTGTLSRRIEEPFSNLHLAVRRRWKEIEEYEPENLRSFEKDLDDWNP